MRKIKIQSITPLFFNPVRGNADYFNCRLEKVINSIKNLDKHLITSNSPSQFTADSTKVLNISASNTGDIFSPGLYRNIAIQKSTSEYIFLIDCDLICAPGLANKFNEQVELISKSSMQGFEMYPCLYLTKEETERFDGDFQGCLESFLRGENHRVEGIALASSCLLLNREWFLQLGGFDEQFVGHGGEDLELIDRLTRHYPIGPRPDDYGLNIKAQHPGDYQGFRRYFSYYALPHLFAGRFLVHQWHPRPLTHPYHKRRAGNDQLLEQMLSRSESERGPLKGPIVPCNDLKGELPDFREWMIRLQEEAGYPVRDYPGLLRWQDGIGPKRPLWRKLRKLYLNPRAFFRDMFKPASH
ncbi:galactosyltransferase-related protein [Aeromonas salmonicida]|uniref:galactosyltransferase-related protein n=1 Tax=Aeromonas salmonicida TaxID=645 RepID=UPI003D313176